MNRREYIHQVARGGLLGALAVFSGILIYRKQVIYEGKCTQRFQCRSCTKLNRCQLPEAELNRGYGDKG
jgi:hypothetical protein